MRVAPPLPLTATVTSKATWTLTGEELNRLRAKLRTLAGKKVCIDIVEHEDTRSVQANNYYWSCVVAPAIEVNGDTDEDFHDEMCLRFLTRRQVEILDYETGEAVQVTIPGRSSRLKIHDFYQFVEQVRKFVGEFLGVTTEDPDPDYWRKRSDGH